MGRYANTHMVVIFQLIDFSSYSRLHLIVVTFQAITRHKHEIKHWYDFVRCAEIKAFVDQIVAPSVRVGTQNLLMVS